MKVAYRFTKQFSAFLVLLGLLQAGSVGGEVFEPGKRIVFLGDSVTAAGQFVTYLDLQLRITHGEDAPELINLGLPSEGAVSYTHLTLPTILHV